MFKQVTLLQEPLQDLIKMLYHGHMCILVNLDSTKDNSISKNGTSI